MLLRAPTFHPSANTIGDLSSGGRGGDTSGAAPVPSFVGARPRLLAFVFAARTCCPPFFMRKAYANDGSNTTPAQEVSHTRARSSTSPASVQVTLMLLSRGPRGAGPCFRIPFCNYSAASSAGSSGNVTRSRQNTMGVHSSLPSIFLHGFALQCRTCAASCTGELFSTLPSQ